MARCQRLVARLVACCSDDHGSDVSHGAGADAADAAQKQDIGALRALVQRKADVNAAQPDGTTALHWAVVWNDEDAVNLLLRAGANAKAANRYGATPLSEAVSVRKRRDGRGAAQGRRRSENADHRRRRDRADDGRARRQRRCRPDAAGSRRGRERAREVQGTDRADVGGGRTPSRRGEAAAGARRRLEGPIVRPRNQDAAAERGFVDLSDRARRIHGAVVCRPRGRHRVGPRDARRRRRHQLRRRRQHQRARRVDHEQAVQLREVPDRSRRRREPRRWLRAHGACTPSSISATRTSPRCPTRKTEDPLPTSGDRQGAARSRRERERRADGQSSRPKRHGFRRHDPERRHDAADARGTSRRRGRRCGCCSKKAPTRS